MKKLLFIGLLFIGLLFTFYSCKKSSQSPDAVPASDATNSIFRVIASSNDASSFYVSVGEAPAGTGVYSVKMKKTSSNNSSFNQGYTPQIGNTVSTEVTGSGSFNVSIYYKGVKIGPSTISSQTIFTYQISN